MRSMGIGFLSSFFQIFFPAGSPQQADDFIIDIIAALLIDSLPVDVALKMRNASNQAVVIDQSDR